ncbi:diguanylate cyclase domain-containing protein [Rhodoferax sp.]|uniref:diguanylate cyclase domain-containing protein n=1 Tax=Rhodoferax sp. TaxID=50421 RepID=UPI00275E7706|nr:diguanylate cyclase [Rhodoferax sp.]
MKHKLQNISIGWRIAMALALPSLAMLAFGFWTSLGFYRSAGEAGRIRGLIEFAATVNTLVHSLQLERGLSTAVLGAERGDFAAALRARQLHTDQARGQFVVALAELDAAQVSGRLDMQAALARQVVDRIDIWRAAVARRAISAPTLIENYAAVVADLMRVVQEMLRVTIHPDLARTLSAYARLMQAKEFAGLERALGVVGFGAGRFESASARRMVELVDRQGLLLDEFRVLAGPSQSDWLDRAWAGSQPVVLNQMRQSAIETAPSGARRPVGVAHWLEVTTRRIELLRTAEERITSDLITQARELEASATRAALWITVIMVLTLTASLATATVLVRDIVRPLKRITQAMRRLAERREVPGLLDEGRADEIGAMVRAIRAFKHNLAQIVQAEAQLQGAQALRVKERYQRALLDNFPFMVWLKDTEGRFLAVNQAVADAHGHAEPDALVGKTEFELLDYAHASWVRADDLAVMNSCQKKMVEQEDVSPSGGAAQWVEIYKAPVTDDAGALLGTVGFSRDITDRKRQQEEIRQLALYDPLTLLPNRRLLSERLSQAIASARRDHTRLALIFVDMDDFKPINDTLGHAVGDALLAGVARRMQRCVREADTTARLGGDEFVVLLSWIDGAAQALMVAEKIRLTLSQPFELMGGHVVSITSSIGVALYPDDGEDEAALSKAADLAMYRAKEMGRNNVQLFRPIALSRGSTSVTIAVPPPVP